MPEQTVTVVKARIFSAANYPHVSDIYFQVALYFFGDCHTMIPPTAITATPISGDQVRWCRLLAVILTSPILATFSLVK